MDDDGERIKAFTRALSRPGVSYGVSRTAKDAMHMLKTQHWDVVFLDHDLGLTPTRDPGDGSQVAKFIVRLARRNGRFRGTRFYIHSINPDGNRFMTHTLGRAGLHVQSVPFVWERIR